MDLANGLFALGGALVTGVPTVTTVIVQARQAREQRQADAAEADKQRDAEAAALKTRIEAEATERAEQRQADELNARRDQIQGWRDGLAASHAQYLSWEEASKDADPAATRRPPPPNILTAGWFMTLRPHLQRTNDGWMDDILDNDDIQCDNDTTNMLATEIARLEREQLGTGNYRMPGRPSRWVRE